MDIDVRRIVDIVDKRIVDIDVRRIVIADDKVRCRIRLSYLWIYDVSACLIVCWTISIDGISP